jgi:hypothetical protein
MSKLIQFLCIFFGYILLSPKQAVKKVSLLQERNHINKQLQRGERVLRIRAEFYNIIIAELRHRGWYVEHGLAQNSWHLRDAYVREM